MVIFAPQLFDGINATLAQDQYVRVEQQKIVQISKNRPSTPPLEPFIELPAETTLMPGLIDAHDHPQLRDVEQKQNDYFAADERQLFARMLHYAQETVRRGVTTVRECGSSHRMGITLARLINGGQAVGPRILSCGNPITSVGGHLAWMGREVPDSDAMRRAIEEEAHIGADFIKLTASGGMASEGTNIYGVQFPVDTLKVARATAHVLGKPVAAHCHSTNSIRAVTEAGIDTIEHCSWAGPGGLEYDAAVVEQMVRQGTTVVFTLATGYPPNRTKERWHRMIGTLEQRLETVRLMIESGVRTIAGTDDSATDTLPYEIGLLAEAGLGTFRALCAATKDSADVLGIGHVTGSIEVGKEADLLAVSGTPLDNVDALKSPILVMSRGRLVMEALPQ